MSPETAAVMDAEEIAGRGAPVPSAPEEPVALVAPQAPQAPQAHQAHQAPGPSRGQREKTVMVSARVPVSLRDRVRDILGELGLSQTELINAAFHYVLEQQELPEVRSPHGQHRRKVSIGEIASFKKRLLAITGNRKPKPEYEGLDDDEVLARALTEKYLRASGGDL